MPSSWEGKVAGRGVKTFNYVVATEGAQHLPQGFLSNNGKDLKRAERDNGFRDGA